MSYMLVRAKWTALSLLGIVALLSIQAHAQDGGVDISGAGPGEEASADMEGVGTETPDEITDLEIVQRRERFLNATSRIEQARDALNEQNYESAIDLLSTAERDLRRISGLSQASEKLVDVQQLLAITYERWADQLVKEGTANLEKDKFDEAIRLYNEALTINPELRQSISERIKRLEEARTIANFQELTSADNVDPERGEREREIALFLEQGRVYFRHRRYMDAREKFEQVLIKDPYNMEATRYLQSIYDELHQDAQERRWAMIKERTAEIEWKWVDPVAPLERPTNPSEIASQQPRVDDEDDIRWKLENIIIPKLTFEEATIQNVVTFLKERSKDLDIEGEGVNIFLRLDQGRTAVDEQPAAEEQPTDEFSFGADEEFTFTEDELTDVDDFGGLDETTAAAPQDTQPTITMDFDNIPLGEAIRYICQGSGLKYRIEPFAVIIADKNVPLTEMETRFYPIDAGFMKGAVTRQVSVQFDTGDDDDDDDGGGTSSGSDPREFFEGLGVEFPEGARISYDGRVSKLIVFNTPENLRRVEEVLQELNVPPTQVTIEAKFVEVRQTTVQEIGFKWLFEGALQSDGTLGDHTNSLGGDAKFIFSQQPDQNGGTLGAGLDTTIGAFNPTNILTVTSILSELQFQTLIYALDKSDGTDLLSAPKVTTISGETAIIDFVQERRFPESFTEPEITTSSGGQVSVTPSTPEFADSEEIGVIFRVTPTVASDGYSIDLELEPVVREFIGYDTTYNTTTIVEGTAVPFRFDTPIFERRSVETRVIVWDGETVVLGGTIRDKVDKRNDKIPFLGDVPLLGRLFRVDGEISEKRNLLVFVTARLVNPAGVPIRPQDIRGMPDFRR